MKNYLEIQEKFERNLCKMADATLHLLHANFMKTICSNFKRNFCYAWFQGYVTFDYYIINFDKKVFA